MCLHEWIDSYELDDHWFLNWQQSSKLHCNRYLFQTFVIFILLFQLQKKVDIEALKHAPSWGLRHRRDSVSGFSTHSQPMGYAFGTHSPAPTYHSGKRNTINENKLNDRILYLFYLLPIMALHEFSHMHFVLMVGLSFSFASFVLPTFFLWFSGFVCIVFWLYID